MLIVQTAVFLDSFARETHQKVFFHRRCFDYSCPYGVNLSGLVFEKRVFQPVDWDRIV